jgi:hypothetical protein
MRAIAVSLLAGHVTREVLTVKSSPLPAEIGILLPNNQRQHRTSHAPKDVLPLSAFSCKSRPESGLDCLMRAIAVSPLVGHPWAVLTGKCFPLSAR